MFKKLLLSLFVLLSLTGVHVQANENQAFEKWTDDKFSMFIHFGLYSHFGGVWNGEPVRYGYSEQIQSFAGIFSDWYAEAADEFCPAEFDADEIVALAKEAGMRSIVFTSKHHDGFCMFRTSTTGFNSVDATSTGRDFVRELSLACEREGIRFGLYFSLIDWHYPYAYPISSHNADFITEQHHELNKTQVRELLTSYGPVSELWFDMGSLTPEQSRELYVLVKELQPDCMVSGRLGNDVYDFAVMADNRLPDVRLHAPWQSAASMFPETWSWRSWQERGEVADKVAQKIRSLTDVVSRGGNYLLNIGPQADGSLVPFEAEVLKKIGEWLEVNGDAVYGTSPSPFRQNFEWGSVTVKGKHMYLILTGVCPKDNLIALPLPGASPAQCLSPDVRFSVKHGKICLDVDERYFDDASCPKVIRLVFADDISGFDDLPAVDSSETLSWSNASPDYSYSCFDYYSNYRSTVAYNWLLTGKGKGSEVEIIYTEDEVGRCILLEIGDFSLPLELDGTVRLEGIREPELLSLCRSRIRGGTFDGPVSWKGFDWKSFDGEQPLSAEFDSRPFSNHVLKAEVSMEDEGYALFSVTSGNGVEMIVDGETLMKHLNPYRTSVFEESVLVYLPKGVSTIAVRSYNRFEKTSACMLSSGDTPVYVRKIILPERVELDGLNVRIEPIDFESVHSDCRLHNVRLKIK